jgi:lysophospholipase L1-like esterase
VGLALGGVLFGLFIAEVLVRALGLAPGFSRLEIAHPNGTFRASEDPVLRYVPKPGVRGVNADGFRDRSYPRVKQGGVYRIIVIGDSIPYGYCNDHETLRPEATFPKLLEQELNAGRMPGIDRFEVLNMGVSGYNTPQEARFLEKYGLAFAPDLVLVTYGLNDQWFASAELFDLRKEPTWAEFDPRSRVFPFLFHHSDLVRFVWQRVPVLAENIKPAPLRRRGEQDSDPTAIGFDMLQELAARSGFRVLVTIVPLFYDFEKYPNSRDHEQVAAKATSRGFPVLDLLPAFREESHGSPRTLQGRCAREHPDEAGHRVMAARLTPFVLEHVRAYPSRSARDLRASPG